MCTGVERRERRRRRLLVGAGIRTRAVSTAPRQLQQDRRDTGPRRQAHLALDTGRRTRCHQARTVTAVDGGIRTRQRDRLTQEPTMACNHRLPLRTTQA